MARYLNFLQRVVAICNGCFLLGMLFRIIHLAPVLNAAVKTILVLGFIVALPLNAFTSVVLAFLLFIRKIRYGQLARGLFILNTLALLVEAVYFLLN